MAGKVNFTRAFAQFGAQVKPYEKTDDVGYEVTRFLWWGGAPYYPIGALIDAKIAGIWLGEGEKPVGDLANIDLIFHMGGGFETEYEIVLRSEAGTSYAGFISAADGIEVTDEIVAGHRVINALFGEFRERYEFDPQYEGGHYRYVGAQGASLSTMVVRSSLRAARRR